MPQANTLDTTLYTLEESGQPPKTRVATARQAKTIYDSLFRSDMNRAKKRALVKGLVDGNPPYRQSDLKAAGRDYQCNVNWRVGESYFNAASGAFYDASTEAPTLATVRTKWGSLEDQERCSRVITEHFNWLLNSDPTRDYHLQCSQNEMVLYGIGPMVFEDEWDWRYKSIHAGMVKVPERTKSDTSEWEVCSVEMEYLPDKLWQKIHDPKSAQAVGWNVEEVKKAIIRAHPETQKGGVYRTWEWHQEQLKNGSLSYSSSSKSIRVVHLFFREFAQRGETEGKITHCIVMAESDGEQQNDFLFQKIGRYKDWGQCIHPMYYDHGGGGFHHSVTGMGVKMYAAIEYQNRLMCNLADKAFTPKVMFKPTNAATADEFSLQQYGEYAVLAENFDALQTPISGVMEEGLVFNREITGLISANLSQYRSNLEEPKTGNPITATEVQFKAGEQARLGKTQLNRYYTQLDHLVAEQYRRASNPALVSSMPGAERALEFQKRCRDDGVPGQALQQIEYVRASRVVGQGSEFMRQQSLDFLLGGVLPMLPENGRDHLIQDVIASRAGQSSVDRYYPQAPDKEAPDDQVAMAMVQVAGMKNGVPAVVTDTQNPVKFAQTFLQAGAQAAQSLQQGAEPREVANFLELDGQAIAAHLQKIGSDKSRAGVYQVLEQQFKQLAAIHDEIVKQVQSQDQAGAEQQRAMREQQAQQQSDFALKRAKMEGMMELKADQQRQKMAMNRQAFTQDQVLADASTAADIHRKAKTAEATIAAKKEAAKNKPKPKTA